MPGVIAEDITTLHYLARYEHPVLQESIRTMKYDSISHIGNIFGILLAESFYLDSYNYVIPVPLHNKRKRERGFNQSEIIAQQLPIQLYQPLKRMLYTKPQAELGRAERLTNIIRAIQLRDTNDSLLPEANVLLIDDVCTTGSTLQHCARILRIAGCNNVDAAVIALD